MTAAELAKAERSAKWFWVSFVVTLLTVQVIVGGVSIYLSVGDPTVAVIPNYHQSALDWDVKHRAIATMQKLGWQVDAVVAPTTDDGTREIEISVVDPQGNAVSDLNIQASVFHHARGSNIEQLRFTETERSTYLANTHITAKGVWQLDIHLDSDDGIAAHTLEIGVN